MVQAATVRIVIVLVGLIAVLVLAWLLLRGRHLDA
jgi:lipopolysaccharide export system protein LptC